MHVISHHGEFGLSKGKDHKPECVLNEEIKNTKTYSFWVVVENLHLMIPDPEIICQLSLPEH